MQLNKGNAALYMLVYLKCVLKRSNETL